MLRRRTLMKGETGYSLQYFTIVAKSDGEIKFDGTTSETSANTLQYSTDGGNTWSTAARSITASVNSGDTVMFKGTCTPYTSSPNIGIGTFLGTTADFDVEGNAMSLLFGDNFIGQKSLSGKDYAFQNLFKSNENVVSIDKMVLPATTLAEGCYRSMFYGCTSLTTAPELPATTLAQSCYYSMFYGCTSLTTAPELPATTLASECYRDMFNRCTSLTTAPELPATTLTESCYRSMFYGCTNLTTAPELLATTLASECYRLMFKNCTGLTTVHKLPATTLAKGCYYQMFHSCTSLATVPSDLLPATTLAVDCYEGMFSRCTSLTKAPELPATTLTNRCYYSMFYNCTSLISIKCLATDISATNCTNLWVSGVGDHGTFVKNASTTWSAGVNGRPSGWTVVNYILE